MGMASPQLLGTAAFTLYGQKLSFGTAAGERREIVESGGNTGMICS